MSLFLKFCVSLLCVLAVHGFIIGSHNDPNSSVFAIYRAAEEAKNHPGQSIEIDLPFHSFFSNQHVSVTVSQIVGEWKGQTNTQESFSIFASQSLNADGSVNSQQRRVGIKCNDI